MIAAGIEEGIEIKDEPSTEATRGASTYSWLKSPPTDTEDGGSEPGLQTVKTEATQDDDDTAHESRKRVHWEDDSKSMQTISSSLGPVTTPAESDDDEEEEEINGEFLDSLYDAHCRRRREALVTPAFAMPLVLVVPDAVKQFFDDHGEHMKIPS